MFIKICGITSSEQAKRVSDLGATHIGVIFFPKSPRHIPLEKIKEIKESIPENTKLVSVVVNPSYSEVEKLFYIVDIVQFHGDESLSFLRDFPRERVIKAFRLKSEENLKEIEKFSDEGFLILVDSFSKESYGGTGKQIDIDIARKIPLITDRYILSGGLSPENLAYLIRELRPFGVDASSKLEISPGVKDLEKVERFINIAKENLGERSR